MIAAHHTKEKEKLGNLGKSSQKKTKLAEFRDPNILEKETEIKDQSDEEPTKSKIIKKKGNETCLIKLNGKRLLVQLSEILFQTTSCLLIAWFYNDIIQSGYRVITRRRFMNIQHNCMRRQNLFEKDQKSLW